MFFGSMAILKEQDFYEKNLYMKKRAHFISFIKLLNNIKIVYFILFCVM
jgi:hypothetical protein